MHFLCKNGLLVKTIYCRFFGTQLRYLNLWSPLMIEKWSPFLVGKYVNSWEYFCYGSWLLLCTLFRKTNVTFPLVVKYNKISQINGQKYICLSPCLFISLFHSHRHSHLNLNGTHSSFKLFNFHVLDAFLNYIARLLGHVHPVSSIKIEEKTWPVNSIRIQFCCFCFAWKIKTEHLSIQLFNDT